VLLGKLPMDDPRVRRARARLFGSWEMNWIAFNYAHDVTLPESTRAPLVHFMYPVLCENSAEVRSLVTLSSATALRRYDSEPVIPYCLSP